MPGTVPSLPSESSWLKNNTIARTRFSLEGRNKALEVLAELLDEEFNYVESPVRTQEPLAAAELPVSQILVQPALLYHLRAHRRARLRLPLKLVVFRHQRLPSL